MGKGQDLYKKAKQLIPGGTMLLSKRPEQFLPENWPHTIAVPKDVKYGILMEKNILIAQ